MAQPPATVPEEAEGEHVRRAGIPAGYVRKVSELLERRVVADMLDEGEAGLALGPKQAHKVHQLVVLRPDHSLYEALEMFDEHKVLSAPVREPDSEEILGFVDSFDVLEAVLRRGWPRAEDDLLGARAREAGAGAARAARRTTAEVLDGVRMPDASEAGKLDTRGQFLLTTVKVGDLVRGRPAHLSRVSASANLYQAVEGVFARGARRAAVVDDAGHLHGLLSQSDVMRYLTLHVPELGEDFLVRHTVEELGLVGAAGDVLHSIAPEDPALRGFLIMARARVSAVPIVGRDGALVGALSMKDLRGVALRGLRSVFDSVTEFLLRSSTAARHPQPPLCVRPNTTFGDAVKEFGLYRGHHLWVVDDERRVRGVVSLTDVMRFLGE